MAGGGGDSREWQGLWLNQQDRSLSSDVQGQCHPQQHRAGSAPLSSLYSREAPALGHRAETAYIQGALFPDGEPGIRAEERVCLLLAVSRVTKSIILIKHKGQGALELGI